MSLVLRDSRNYAELKEFLGDVVRQHPSNENLLFDYGIALFETGEKEQSIGYMQRVIKLNPRNADALNFIAYAWAEQGVNLGEAQKLVERALEIRPDEGYYVDTLGWVHFRQGRYAEAEELLKRAVQLSGADYVILEHYGDVLAKRGRVTRAISIYEIALDAAQDNTDSEAIEASDRLRTKLVNLRDS